MVDDSFGVELKNIKLKACVLNWGVEWGCFFKDFIIIRFVI